MLSKGNLAKITRNDFLDTARKPAVVLYYVQEFNRMSQCRDHLRLEVSDPRADSLEGTVTMPNLSALWQLPLTSVSLARLHRFHCDSSGRFAELC